MTPLPPVHAMFDEARARFGHWGVAENCITTWLRKHVPPVAALWPDAPLTAAWFDWRCRVNPENTSVLDQALNETSKGSRSSHE